MLRSLAWAVCGVAALLIGQPAQSHDFWLDLSSWRVAGESAEIKARFLVGHAAEKEDWALKPERIVALNSFGPAGAVDQRAGIILPKDGEPGGAKISLAGEGTHVIAFETSNAAYSDLPPDRFNPYVEEEGLAPAAAYRREHNLEQTNGRERYSRRAKAIVQFGDATSDQAHSSIGHTLEITPLSHPYRLKDGRPLTIEVRYEGAPLPGALVHFESLEAGWFPEVKKLTDDKGRAEFDFPHRGAWKFNVVWTKPIEGDPKADFETVFASLTIGY